MKEEFNLSEKIWLDEDGEEVCWPKDVKEFFKKILTPNNISKGFVEVSTIKYYAGNKLIWKIKIVISVISVISVIPVIPVIPVISVIPVIPVIPVISVIPVIPVIPVISVIPVKILLMDLCVLTWN